MAIFVTIILITPKNKTKHSFEAERGQGEQGTRKQDQNGAVSQINHREIPKYPPNLTNKKKNISKTIKVYYYNIFKKYFAFFIRLKSVLKENDF